MTDDNNIRPSYYNRGGIEAIAVIKAWKLSFETASAVKYIARAGHKPDETTNDLRDGHLRDLRKARTYLDLEIAHLMEAGPSADTPPNGTDQQPLIKAPEPGATPGPEIPISEPVEDRPRAEAPSLVFVSANADDAEPWTCDGCSDSKTARERYRVGGADDYLRYCAQCTSEKRREVRP
jgi:hypothetical protein